jgi:hypothetical protein
MIANANPIIGNLPLICVTLILVSLVVGAVLVWDKPPWWVRFPTPRRQHDVDRERYRDARLRRRALKKFPNLYDGEIPPNGTPDPPANAAVSELVDLVRDIEELHHSDDKS